MRAAAWLRGLVLIATCVSSAACGAPSSGEGEPVDRRPRSDTVQSTTGAGSPGRGLATFTAVEASRIAMTLHEAGIKRARLATERTVSADVRTYAARMLTEHAAAIARLRELSGANGKGQEPLGLVQAPEDPTPVRIDNDAVAIVLELDALPRTAFDLAFMTAEVTANASAVERNRLRRGFGYGEPAPFVFVSGMAGLE